MSQSAPADVSIALKTSMMNWVSILTSRKMPNRDRSRRSEGSTTTRSKVYVITTSAVSTLR